MNQDDLSDDDFSAVWPNKLETTMKTISEELSEWVNNTSEVIAKAEIKLNLQSPVHEARV